MGDIKIEQIKSWFILAEILIVAAGFMFASSGIYWTNFLDTMRYSTEVNNKALDITMNNNSMTLDYANSLVILTGELNDFSKNQLKLSERFFNSGMILSGISIIFWIYGKYRLHKLKI